LMKDRFSLSPDGWKRTELD